MSNRRPDHGSRASLEREGDRGPRGPRPGSVVPPSKGLRAVFAPLVDYGDDSDEEEEPASPGDITMGWGGNKGSCSCGWLCDSTVIVISVVPSVMSSISCLQVPLGLTRSCLQAKA